jgi:hypothetical protein
MLRITIRDLVWLMVVVVVGTAVFVTRSGRESDRRAVMRRASEQELEAIGARYRAAKGEFEWYASQRDLANTRWSIDDACSAIERFALETETINDLETRAKDLAKALELAQYLEATVQEGYEKDIQPFSMVHRTRYTRTDVEVRFRRADQELTMVRGTR